MGDKYVYVLELEKGRYYVGLAEDAKKRIEQHFNGEGAWFTKKFKPVKVVEVIPNCGYLEERYHTLRYMNKYGHAYVRGYIWLKSYINRPDGVLARKFVHRCNLCKDTNYCYEEDVSDCQFCGEKQDNLFEKEFHVAQCPQLPNLDNENEKGTEERSSTVKL